MIIIGPVGSCKDASTDLRQDREIDILIVETKHIVRLVLLLFRHHVIQRIGIDVAFSPLIDSAGKEDGIHFGRTNLIGRDLFCNGLHPHLLLGTQRKRTSQQQTTHKIRFHGGLFLGM